MRRIAVPLLAVLVSCLSSLAASQERDQDVNVGWVYAITPKPGMVKQWEEGRKRHMDFHRKQNDSWEWDLWQVVSGDGFGTYLSTTFGHSWHDLDSVEQRMQPADSVDGDVNMAPYVGSESGGIWMLLKSSSNLPAGNEPPKMGELNHFLLKPGTEAEFSDAVHKISNAIVKANWGGHYAWYALLDGGERPHYVLFLYMNGWADLAEPHPSLPEMLEKTLGKSEAEALTHSIYGSVKKEWSETIRYRQDLSYVPSAK